MWVRFLGWEDPLEEEMATHSSILALEISQTEGLVVYSPWGHKRVWHNLPTKQQNVLSNLSYQPSCHDMRLSSVGSQSSRETCFTLLAISVLL